MKHRVRVNIADARGRKQPVLESCHLRLPMRLLRWLFGDFTEVLVLTPSASVKEIEIHAIGQGGVSQ